MHAIQSTAEWNILAGIKGHSADSQRSALTLTNFIFVSRVGDVQFIDYEYSGYNYLAYDIGNHFNEFAGTVVTWLLMAWTLALHQDWMISASQCAAVQIEPLLRFLKASFARHVQVL